MARWEMVTTGLHQQTISGATTIGVQHEHVYELTATAAATVTLDGFPGAQVAILWAGADGVVAGQDVQDGERWVAVNFSAGWAMFEIGDPAPATPVTATAPSFDDATGTYTLADQVGVRWKVGGVTTAPGPHMVAPPVSVTVTAQAASGYVLVGAASWTHAFPALPSPPLAPDEITDLLAWYDPADVTSVTLDGSSRVSELRPQNASSIKLVQTDAAKRPYRDGAISSVTALRTTDATATNMALVASANYDTPWPTEGTTFAVARCDSAGASWNVVVDSNPHIRLTPALLMTEAGTQAITTGRAYFIVVTRNATETKLYLDGVLVKTGAGLTTTIPNHSLFGGSGSGNLTVGDVGFYDRALTETEAGGLYLWAKGKWGLP